MVGQPSVGSIDKTSGGLVDKVLQLMKTKGQPTAMIIVGLGSRHDICQKHHKQRLCKIISTRVKFHLLNILSMFNFVFCQYSVISTNDKV